MSVGRGVFWKKNTVDSAYRLDMVLFAQDVDLEHAASGYTTWKVAVPSGFTSSGSPHHEGESDC